MRLFLSLLVVLSMPAARAISQDSRTSAASANPACAMPTFSNVVHEPNMFNEEQETWMGELLDPQIRRAFHTIADPEGDYLDKVGARLLAQLPAGEIRYKFRIIDFPDNNAFGFAGGYIYVSRRIISLAQNEDEIAGLLAHEIGHIITHQSAIDLTRQFKMVLGVNQITDRNDLLEKWNRLLDNEATRKVKFSEKREQQEQLIADRIALYAMARAGYNPSRFADFFDRLAQTKGNTGNFWSDLFGRTSQDSKRLRELVRNSAPEPPVCVSPLPADYDAHFLKWKKEVIAAAFAVPREELPGLRQKVTLTPPFHTGFRQVRFSPDGKYVLAQDNASVFILSRTPFENLFRVDAPDAAMAHFTPDSSALVFVDKELRVEKWDVRSGKRTSVNQVVLPMDCERKSLSPTGDLLACIVSGPELRVLDVQTNEVVIEKSDLPKSVLMSGVLGQILESLHIDLTNYKLRFSPDGGFLAVGSPDAAFAFDLKRRTELKMSKDLRRVLQGRFVFDYAGDLYGFAVDEFKPVLRHFKFPSGELREQFPLLAKGELGAATHGDYLMLLHTANFAVGLIELKQKQITHGYKLIGFDVYDDVVVSETNGGALAMMTVDGTKSLATSRVPGGPMQSPGAMAFSSNGNWLAISDPNRTAVWDLRSGKRVALVAGMEGILFEGDQLTSVSDRSDNEPRRVLQLNAAQGASRKLYELADDSGGPPVRVDQAMYLALKNILKNPRQEGPLLLTIVPKDKLAGGGVELVANDLISNKELWRKLFKKTLPKIYSSTSTATIATVVESNEADTRQNPQLKGRIDALSGKGENKNGYVVETFDAKSGTSLGTIVVDTGSGSFKVRSVAATREFALVHDSKGRTLIYSLKSGLQTGRVFGAVIALSRAGDRMLLEKSAGEAELVDVNTLQTLARYTFGYPLILGAFSDDGNTLNALTAEQVVYQIRVDQQNASVQ